MMPVKTIREFEADSYRREIEAQVVAVVEDGIYLDRTIFYAESGGQPGDTGFLTTGDGQRLRVVDTVYTDGKLRILHKLDAPPPPLAAGTIVHAEIDWVRRYRHMQMHSALHIVCGLIDAPVTGCAIYADRGRLDFDLPENTLDKVELTDTLNKLLHRNLDLSVLNLGNDEIVAYRSRVRTADVSPPLNGDALRMIEIPGIDLQPCGGTHVANTSEIGAIVVSKIEKKSRYNRRVNIAFVEMG